jgi:MFS family permease
VPFYGTYQINELALSLKTVSLLVILGNISRILVSRLWGKYADRKTFAAMTEKCLIFLGIAQICALFAVPKNGVVMFALYYFFYGIAMGGINSALINLIFDYVAPEKRSDSLAITQAASGVVGFLTTVCLSPLVTLVQNSNNTIFGVHIYAQQLCTLISLLITAVSVIYVKKVITWDRGRFETTEKVKRNVENVV